MAENGWQQLIKDWVSLSYPNPPVVIGWNWRIFQFVSIELRKLVYTHTLMGLGLKRNCFGWRPNDWLGRNIRCELRVRWRCPKRETPSAAELITNRTNLQSFGRKKSVHNYKFKFLLSIHYFSIHLIFLIIRIFKNWWWIKHFNLNKVKNVF